MLVGITLLTFLLSHAVPADPVTASLGEQAAADPAVVAAFRREWGLDRSLPEQYGIYLWNLVRGNFGISISTRQPVWLDLRQTFPATVELAVVAMAASILAGIPLGVLSAVKRGRLIDHLTRVISLVGVSMPIFWLGLMLILVFGGILGWLPIGGLLPIGDEVPRVTGMSVLDALFTGKISVVGTALRYLLLPALTLATIPLALVTRITRSEMLSAGSLDHVRTARAKGLPEWRVIVKHTLRNALIPVVTVIGLQLGLLLSGAVLTETIFALPGLGRLMVASILSRDYPVVQAGALLTAFVFVLVNLLVDISYAYLDPRIRYR
jgi:peptide/nickel transport system permease protein